ncbi:hypothetical protein [Nocardioides sp. AX2bis]|uniref:hypothetical protein n=1 Tax=Nocardioides sp. AX2bis TaxID=2653157 RepID=UPI0012EF830A|nr:hypothetical protein [Nocardioides sp. AX2bis]VXC23695.1 hypothetical protein NOCARDAX2BIS_480082 [Nocardioides sp. AX2bis]
MTTTAHTNDDSTGPDPMLDVQVEAVMSPDPSFLDWVTSSTTAAKPPGPTHSQS